MAANAALTMISRTPLVKVSIWTAARPACFKACISARSACPLNQVFKFILLHLATRQFLNPAFQIVLTFLKEIFHVVHRLGGVLLEKFLSERFRLFLDALENAADVDVRHMELLRCFGRPYFSALELDNLI